MFRTKKDVDKHAEEIFKNIKIEKERNLRCLSIGQQYINVGDFETANKYLNLYLSVKDDSSIGHKLLGQCYEHFGEKEKALAAYKYSLKLDYKQPELILKVCELFGDSTLIVDKADAKFWLEKCELRFPYHKTVLNLKQKLNSLSDNEHPGCVESSIMNELKCKPKDPSVHCRLLSFYIDNKRPKEAYNEAFIKDISFIPTLQWYQCAVQVCKLYKTQFPNSIDERFYSNYLFSMERCLAMSVQDVKMYRRSIPECILLLAKFDEMLSTAASLANKSDGFQSLIGHMSGQLCFHMANIMYRKIKWDDVDAQEIYQCISPLLLLSTSAKFDVFNFKKQDPVLTRILIQCSLLSTYRLSQAGFVILSLAKNSFKYFLEKVFHTCVGDWKEKILEKVYKTSELKNFSKTSFFVNCAAFSELPPELSVNVIEKIERFLAVTEEVQSTSLHHLVWLGLRYLTATDQRSICDMVLPSEFYTRSFHTLQYSHNNELSCYAETLCKIDVDSFLYACVYCAESAHLQQTDTISKLLQVLPADVSKSMCSPEHDLWWESAHQMSNQGIPEESFGRVRLTLQRGIEVVRLMGNNDLPLPLLVLLARTFSKRASAESTASNAVALESRALLYWKAAVPHLTRIIRDESYTYPKKTMFDYFGKPVTKPEALKLLEETKRLLGGHYLAENDNSILDEDGSNTSINSRVIQKNRSLNTSFVESMLNENFAEPSSKISGTLGGLIHKVEAISLNASSKNDSLLRNLSEENKKLVDKLEVVSSQVMQMFHMVSVLSNKMEELKEAFTNSATAALQPNGYQQNNQISRLGHTLPCDPLKVTSMAASVSSPLLNNYLLRSNIQTNYPMQPFNYLPTSVSTTTVPSFPHNIYSNNIIASGQIPSLTPFLPTSSQFNQSYSLYPQSMLVQPSSSSSPFVSSSYVPPPPPPSSSSSVKSTSHNVENNFLYGPMNSVVSSPQLMTSSSSGTAIATTPIKSCSYESKNSTPASTPHSFQISAPDSSSIIQAPSVEVPDEIQESDDEVYKEHDPCPNFKPIIPLPDEVPVTTGEEEEDILFESRVKLYRYDDKEWKERGIGILKILKNRNTGRVRVLMRREVVHKICANHLLASNMTLQELSSCDKAWVYSAPDFSDEKTEVLQFCIKFKNPEIAREFKNVFDENKGANEKVSASTLNNTSKLEDSSSRSVSSTASTLVKSPIQNDLKVDSNEEKKTQFGGFTFNSKPIIKQSSALETEKKDEEKPKTPFGAFSFNMSGLSKPDSSFTLFKLATVTDPEPENKKSEENSSMPFASVKHSIDFSSLSKNSSTNAFAKSDNFKGFAGAGSLVFGSKVTDKVSETPSAVSAILKGISSSPSPSSIVTTTASSSKVEESHADGEDEFVPTAEFKPVVPLPDVVEVKTGEEGLEVLYEVRCKLFRYANNEWKERGIGNMKILKDPFDNSFRLIMRREQVHKVCCNQRLTRELELMPINTSNKAWTWTGSDFSEGELTNELFCVRFKTVEQADEFKKAVKTAQEGIRFSPQKPTKTKPATGAKEGKSLPKLSEMFKSAEGSWNCEVCYVNNPGTSKVCAACQSSKDGSAPTEGSFPFNPSSTILNVSDDKSKSSIFSEDNSETKQSQFKFGIKTEAVSTASFTFGTATTGTTFTFGTDKVTNTPSSSVFSFGSVLSGTTSSVKNIETTSVSPKFASSSPTPPISTSAPATTTSNVFMFGKSGFNLQSLSGGLSNSSPATSEDTSNAMASKSKSVPFSGSSLFGSTASSQTATTIFGQNTSAFTTFSFKLPANEGTKSKIIQDHDKKDVDQKSSSSDELEFVFETQISEEDKKKAESLMLPSKFYAYKYKDDCKGCVGCDPEDIKNKSKSNSKIEISDTETFNLNSTPVNKLFGNSNDLNWTNNAGFVFGKDTNTGVTFNFKNAFANKTSTASATTETEEAGSDDDSVVPNDNDPHFEPLIPLPDIVETKTGEEEESILFSSRAKLYRYDNNKREWKERGIGELKILHHPSQNSYRLLLRREQVHKIVLNQRINSSMTLEPMSTSKNSWCWYGLNMSEEYKEPVLENLAIRFKTQEVADQFHTIINDCVTNLDSSEVIRKTSDRRENENSQLTNSQSPSVENENVHDDLNYVDEEGLVDAMLEYEDDNVEDDEIIHEEEATLQVLNESKIATEEYIGLIKIMRTTDADGRYTVMEFEAEDYPSLYIQEINSEVNVDLDGNSVFIPNPTDTNQPLVLRFSDEQTASCFYAAFHQVKSMLLTDSGY